MDNVEIYQSGQFTITKAGGKQIAACQIKGNARALFKAAIGPGVPLVLTPQAFVCWEGHQGVASSYMV